jgi:hypothetical protein
MFPELPFKMQANTLELFWLVIYISAPGFVAAVLYGLYEQSMALNRKPLASAQTWRYVFVVDGLSVLWMQYLTDWPLYGLSADVVGAILCLCGLGLLFGPIFGGLGLGAWLMKAYWFLRLKVYRFFKV